MALPRSSARGIGAVAALALVVGLATLRTPAPLRTLPPDGVWMFEDSLGSKTRIVHIGIWPGYVQYVETPASFVSLRMIDYETRRIPEIYYNSFKEMRTGILDESNGRAYARFYESIDTDWRDEGSVGEVKYKIANPVPFRAIESQDGVWRLVEGGEGYRLRHLKPGPRPLRFAIQTSSCPLGGCPDLSLEVDARGHVEYEGFRNVSRIGRFTSDDGGELFRMLERTAALARPDSIRYSSSGHDGQIVDVVIDYETGQRVSQSSMWLENEAYYLFASEVHRLLPTLALTPAPDR